MAKKIEDFSVEELEALLADAKNDDTPTVVPTLDEDVAFNVVGDVNAVKELDNSYTIKFIEVPETIAKSLKNIDDVIIGESGLASFTMTRSVPTFSPMKRTQIQSAATQLILLFNKLNENGTMEANTQEEQEEIFAKLGDEGITIFYNFVSNALGIDKSVYEYMEPVSVMENLTTIITNNPDFFQ